VLWSVVHEHLDEAEFCAEQFERALDGTMLTLKDLARYPEYSLLAHVDGLIVGGETVQEQLLLPQLRDPEAANASRYLAIALALCGAKRMDQIYPAFGHADASLRAAFVRAAELVASTHLDAWASARVQLSLPSEELSALLDLLWRRGLPPPSLMGSLQSKDDAIVTSAVHAAAWGDRALYLPVIESLLDHANERVRGAAMMTGLHWRSRRAWGACEHSALDALDSDPLACALYAALGGRREHQQLLGLLGNAAHTTDVLFALAFSGNVRLAPVCLEYLGSAKPLERKFAAQAFAALTGLDLHDDAYIVPAALAETAEEQKALPALSEDDLDADLVPVPEDALPDLDVSAVSKFWQGQSQRFDAATRLQGGEPYSLRSALDHLTRTPLRLCHVSALALSIRTQGAIRIRTRVFSAAQRLQLSAANYDASLCEFANW
jgi:uncharacterized protein (TIGR02270 family)